MTLRLCPLSIKVTKVANMCLSVCVCLCVCVCVCVCVCLCVLVCVPADNIETQVETAAVRVEGGNKQLEKAVRHKVYTHTSTTVCNVL